MQTPQNGTQGENVQPNNGQSVPPVTPPQDSGSTVPAKTPREIELENKFSASAREAQRLLDENKKLAAEMQQLKETPLSTDDQYRQTVPEWDDLSDAQKKVIVEHDKLKAQLATVQSKLTENESEKAIDSLIASRPELKGKEADFKAYVKLPENQGLNLHQITKAFMFDQSSQKPPETPIADGIPVTTTRQDIPNSNGLMNEDQLADLHKSNPQKFMDEMMSGKYKVKS